MKLNRKGFTLIELVIVIIIIAILAAVAIPRFRDLARHAREASERATVTAVRQAITIYRAYNELEEIEPVFPADLDGELTGHRATVERPLFDVVMEPGAAVIDGWEKVTDATIDTYKGPTRLFTYTYNPDDGSFVASPVP